MKEIKDYLHLYLGCDVEHDKGIYRGTLIGMDSSCAKIHCDFFQREKGHRVPKERDFGYFDILQDRIKPILRPLSDMIEEERYELQKVQDFSGKAFYEMAATVKFLLSKHFDLFNLISEGLAIDKTKQLNNAK